MINIEIVYALSDTQVILQLQVEDNTTVFEAIQLSGLLENFPQINLELNHVGIFGKVIKLDAALRNRDRVEIYRPLINDPKEIRRQRADQVKKAKLK